MQRLMRQPPVVAHAATDQIEFRAQPARVGQRFELPTDLRQWLDCGTLLQWIELELEESGGNDLDCSTRTGDYLPGLWLRLLALAYTIALFRSEEIVRRCHTDPFFRRLCEDKAPFLHELVTFRRTNRSLLQKVMAGVFLRAVSNRFDLDGSALPFELNLDLQQRALERLDIARHLDNADE